MKKTLIAIIIAALFIINIVAAAFIFVDIHALKFPQTTIRIDVIEINSDEVIIHHTISMYNPNSFEMILQDFQVIATTASGDEVTRITVDGGSIPGQSNKSFTADDRITMSGNLTGLLTSTVSGIVGINILGVIKKTIPLEITILTSIEDVLKKIALPTVNVRTEFGTITRESIGLTAEIDVSNPNSFNFFFNDITVDIATETGVNVGDFTIASAQIPAEGQVTLHGVGTIRIEALNAKKLLVDLNAEAGAVIAGINKTLPFSTHMEIGIPDINSFIPADQPLELALKIDFQRGKKGLNGNMTLEVINPTKLPFIASDIVVDYYGVKHNQKYFITAGPLGSGELVPENTTLFQGDIFLSYVKLLNFSVKGLFPDMVFAQLRAKISLSGVNLSLPVALGSYVDIRLFRVNT